MDRRKKYLDGAVRLPSRSRSLTPSLSPRALTPDPPRAAKSPAPARAPDAAPKKRAGTHAKLCVALCIAVLLLIATVGATRLLTGGAGSVTRLTRRSARESFGAVFSETRQLVKVEPYTPAQTARLGRYVGHYVVRINGAAVASLDDVNLALQGAGKELALAFVEERPPATAEAPGRLEEREAVPAFALGQPVRVAKAMLVSGREIAMGAKGIVMAVLGGRHDTHVAEVEVAGTRFLARHGDLEEYEVDRTVPARDEEPAAKPSPPGLPAMTFRGIGVDIDAVFTQLPYSWNALPVYTDPHGRYLYATKKGKWMIGQDRESVRRERGSCRSHYPHRNALPHLVADWDVYTQGGLWEPVQVVIHLHGPAGELLPSQQAAVEEAAEGKAGGTFVGGEAESGEASSPAPEVAEPGARDAEAVHETEEAARDTGAGGEEEKEDASNANERVQETTPAPAMVVGGDEEPQRDNDGGGGAAEAVEAEPTPAPETPAPPTATPSPSTAAPPTPVPPTRAPPTPVPPTRAPPTPVPPTRAPPTAPPVVNAVVDCTLDPYAAAPRMFVQWGETMSAFELQVKGWNGLPVWKDEAGHALFSSNGGKWMIGGANAYENNKGTFVSAAPHDKRRPQAVTHWQQLDAHGAWVPARFHLICEARYPSAEEHGVGQKHATKRPEFITFTSETWASTFKLEKMLWLGMPVWKNGLDLKLFNTNGGFWMVGDPVQNKGFVKTAEKNSKRRMPHRFEDWEIIGMAGAENRWSPFDSTVEAWDKLEYKHLFKGGKEQREPAEQKVDLRLLKFVDSGAETWDCALGAQYGDIDVAQKWVEEAKALGEQVRFKSSFRLVDLDARPPHGYKAVKAAVFRDPVSRFMARLAAGEVSCNAAPPGLKFFDLTDEERAACAGLNSNLYVRMLAEVPQGEEVGEAHLDKARAALAKFDYVTHLAMQDQALYMMKADLGMAMSGYPKCWQKTQKLVPTDAQAQVVEQMNAWDVRLMLDVKAMFQSRWEAVAEQGTYAASECSAESKLCFARKEPLRKVKADDAAAMNDLRQHINDNDIVCAQHCAWGLSV